MLECPFKALEPQVLTLCNIHNICYSETKNIYKNRILIYSSVIAGADGGNLIKEKTWSLLVGGSTEAVQFKTRLPYAISDTALYQLAREVYRFVTD